MRRQVKAYLTAHGTDPDTVDEETFTDICIMYNDGMIGNIGILQTLGMHAAGHFNTVLQKGAAPYRLQDIIPTQYEYLYPPLSEEEKAAQVSKNLMAFAALNPNAPEKIVKGQ